MWLGVTSCMKYSCMGYDINIKRTIQKLTILDVRKEVA
jgi:hypothetical protein